MVNSSRARPSRSSADVMVVGPIAGGASVGARSRFSNQLRVDFPDDESMGISHEAIYQALYIQGRGALKRELVACLRTERALRVPRRDRRVRRHAARHPDGHQAGPSEDEDRPGRGRRR
jgi:IS30 family transposase